MSMTVPSDSPQQQLAQLLSALTQPDTQTIRHAEQAMKPLLKDPRCVPALVEILKGTGPSGQQVSVFFRVCMCILLLMNLCILLLMNVCILWLMMGEKMESSFGCGLESFVLLWNYSHIKIFS